jgi:predicted RNA methylase
VRFLLAEFEAAELPVAQMIPEPPFGIRGLAA